MKIYKARSIELLCQAQRFDELNDYDIVTMRDDSDDTYLIDSKGQAWIVADQYHDALLRLIKRLDERVTELEAKQ